MAEARTAGILSSLGMAVEMQDMSRAKDEKKSPESAAVLPAASPAAIVAPATLREEKKGIKETEKLRQQLTETLAKVTAAFAVADAAKTKTQAEHVAALRQTINPLTELMSWIVACVYEDLSKQREHDIWQVDGNDDELILLPTTNPRPQGEDDALLYHHRAINEEKIADQNALVRRLRVLTKANAKNLSDAITALENELSGMRNRYVQTAQLIQKQLATENVMPEPVCQLVIITPGIPHIYRKYIECFRNAPQVVNESNGSDDEMDDSHDADLFRKYFIPQTPPMNKEEEEEAHRQSQQSFNEIANQALREMYAKQEAQAKNAARFRSHSFTYGQTSHPKPRAKDEKDLKAAKPIFLKPSHSPLDEEESAPAKTSSQESTRSRALSC